MYYGQFDPPVDKVIEEYFPNHQNGNCIEIGAVDGVYLSNTLFFEQKGWNCLCIEPIPFTYEKLKNNRKNTLNFAISQESSEERQFNLVSVSNNNDYNAISGLTLDDRLVNDHKQHYQVNNQIISVKSRRLDWCIENYFNHNTIDFISIDTEGSELDVVKSFDVNRYNIKLLVIENNYNDSDVEDFLKENGWKKDRRVFVNDFYIKK